MTFPDLQNINIANYRNRNEIIQQVAAQIEKDFAQFGMEVHFSGKIEMAYTELFNQVDNHIDDLLINDYHRLKILLYQIDLSEKKIAQTACKYPDVPQSKILTELIIERELKKVLIRNYFKENPNA